MTRRLLLHAATLLLCVTLSPSEARAGVFDLFGFGSRNMGMGNAATATASDHTATYYNPANLTKRKQIQLGATVLGVVSALSIDPSSEIGDPDLQAVQASETGAGLSLGVLFPLGGRIEDRVAFGLGLYLPLGNVIRIQALDPATPRWYLYNSLPDKLQIVLGAAFEITDWVSVGVGIQSLAELDGDVQLDIDLSNGTFDRRDVVVQLINTAAPIVGLDFRPADGLSVGLSYRAALDLGFSLPLFFNLGDGLDIDVQISGTDLYTPHQINLGGAYTVPLPTPLTLAADATLSLWTLAPDPALDVQVAITGDIPEGLGLGDVLTLVTGDTPSPGFRDSLTVRLGAELQATEWLTLRSGYFWRQAALQSQDGVTSFLDSDAHTLSIGASFTFEDPLEIGERPVTFDIFSQALIHPEATAEKQRGNPVPPTAYGGALFTFGGSIRHDF